MARKTGQIISKGDNKWLVRIFLGRDRCGKRKYFSHTVEGTKKDAQKFLNAKLHDSDLGISIEASNLTLNDYLDRWLHDVVRIRVSERTADGYAGLLDRYVRKPLGNKKIETLNTLDFQKVYADMQSRGLSARIVRHTHSALHNALKQAVKWDILNKNVVEYCELPKVPHTERRVLSQAESLRFLQQTATMPNGIIFEFALLSGMRPEEFLATQWKDLDFERCAVQVKRALVRHKGKWSFENPKTAKSRRTVSLPSALFQKLKSHRVAQNETRLKNGLVWENHDLVFCSEVGTPHSIPNLTYRYYRPILQKADLPRIRLYDLRHSNATLLLIAQENPKVVAERLGHSTVVLTLDTYSHVLPTMQKAATDKLDKMLYGT